MFRCLSLSASAVLLTLAAHAQAQAPAAISDATPVIESGNLSITKGEFERMLASDGRMRHAMTMPNGRQVMGIELGKAFALEAEARRRKLDEDPGVQLRIRNYAQQLLASELVIALRKDYLAEDKQLRATYEASKDAYSQPRVRQILIRTPGSQVPLRKGQRELTVAQASARANALLAKLVKGADFATLAKAESDDTGSAAKGGDLGFIIKGATAAEFENAAFSLPLGELSKPVKTEFGFHILRVEERQPMPYDMVKASIANDMAHADLDKLILNGYKLNSAYFGGK